MKNYKISIILAVGLFFMAMATSALAYETITVNAGPDLYLVSGQTTTLQGSAYTPTGYYLNHYWSCTGGNLSSYNILNPTYTAPNLYNNGYQANYTCTLTATDTLGNSNSDSIMIYVNYNNSNSNLINTNSATNITNYQATLNGNLSGNTSYSNNYVYFQWGTTENYGNETTKQSIVNSGSFTKDIYNLIPNTTYHFRAVMQGNYGISYGGDMTFNTNNPGNYTNYLLNADKKIINLTSKNYIWSSNINAKPLDILTFAITLQPTSQNIYNVSMRDILPAGLIYKGNLMVNTSSYTGNISDGVNIGTIYANQPTVVSYQAQVASADSFAFGTNTINNNTTITSNNFGTQNVSSVVTVNKSAVYGATTISTGLTNNPLTDSFFIPLFIIFIGMWACFSGNANKMTDWIKNKLS